MYSFIHTAFANSWVLVKVILSTFFFVFGFSFTNIHDS